MGQLLTVRSDRAGDLLLITLSRTIECERSFHFSRLGSLVQDMSNQVLTRLTSIARINSIPLCSTRFLHMTGFPIEVNIGLTCLTLTDMFESAGEPHITLHRSEEVDIRNIFQSFEHVLLINDYRFFTRSDLIFNIVGTIRRFLEGHFNEHLCRSRAYIAIGKFGFVPRRITHLVHAETIERRRLRHMLNHIGLHMHVRERIILFDNGISLNLFRLVNQLHLHADGLIILNTEIDIRGLHRFHHTLRYSIIHRFAGSEGEGAFGQTGRGAVERLTGNERQFVVTLVGNSDLCILAIRLFDRENIQTPPCGITCRLGHLGIPTKRTSIFTGLVQVRRFEHLGAQLDSPI